MEMPLSGSLMGNKRAAYEESIQVDVHVLLADLKSCSVRRNLQQGQAIHAKVLEAGHDSSTHVATALVNMYAKCGSMNAAHRVFDRIRQPDVVSWTALLLGYADSGEGLIALDLFLRMKSQDCTPDSMTYVAALKACTSLALKKEGSEKADCLERGKRIHSEIGCHMNLYVQNALIDMYSRCGSMKDARKVFDSIRIPTVVSWNALILGYADSREGLVALDLFLRMKSQDCAPNSITYVAALKASSSLATKQDGHREQGLQWGKQIHSEIGRHMNLYVQNALIDMYARCGSTVDACQVFENIRNPDTVSWNGLLLGYADSGQELVALDLFSRMKSQGYAPNSVTYLAALKACASLALKQDGSGKTKCLERGRQIHSEIACHLSLYVQTTLVDMYAKCGSMADAHHVFDCIEHPSVVSWNALLLGYADNEQGFTALGLFSRMKSGGYRPDPTTFIAALKACALLGALEFGRKVHAEISEFDVVLVTCLVDFYAKCGSMTEAHGVFDLHSKTRDVTTWTALLSGYSSFGETDFVFVLLDGMQDAGFQPDAVTFQCILMCCSHAGLVDRAKTCFESMSAKYTVTPAVEHYNCMVDVLGRANNLDEAVVLLERMPCSPDTVTWMTFLGASRKFSNVEMGRLAFQCLANLDERKQQLGY